ncbi:hypothetical protein L1276_000944 [Flavobacterium sp. HSC-32F16]|uniref:hypothetical protein n=1 Tax=Flavobacterium sp. HSC-32F16 TaxID=2910964 RepID=UPI0020A4C775|nr:hypothetical protein [Flavobacterium sp. HSC-32F16]MCP2025804.1 hypothetical protein [Flavobacterium sp. HSC-32F16]
MKYNEKNDKSKLQKSVYPKVEISEDNCKLTLAELRRCEGFEDVSDLEGEEIIESLYKLSLIAYNYRQSNNFNIKFWAL